MRMKINNAIRTMTKMIASNDLDQLNEATDFLRDASLGMLDSDGFENLSGEEQNALNNLFMQATDAKIALRDAGKAEPTEAQKLLAEFPPSMFPKDYDELVKVQAAQIALLREMPDSDRHRQRELNKLIGITNALMIQEGEVTRAITRDPAVTRVGSVEDMRLQAEALFEKRFQASEMASRQAENLRQIERGNSDTDRRREAFRKKEIADYEREERQARQGESSGQKPEGYFEGSAYDDSMNGLI